MKLRGLLTIVLLGLLLGGCSSKSNFYQLHTASVDDVQRTKHIKKTVIGIAEVDLPEYLDKPQIVTRLSASQLKVNETERWVGAFDKNIQSVLANNLAKLLPQYSFLTRPWEEPVEDRYRIYLSVERFDGDAQTGVVSFRGRWSLVDVENNRLITGEDIDYSERGGANVDALVNTQSRLLERLSRHIAQRVKRYL